MESSAPAPALFPLPVVLVVDPDPDNRELYSLMLSDIAHDIQQADDGRIALAKTLVQPPNLVVTDTQVPFIDGYALSQLLRRDPATANVPIVITTSDGTAAGAKRAVAAGANAVLVKPFLVEPFIATIRRVVEAQSAPRPGMEPSERDASRRRAPLQIVDRGRPRIMSHVHERYATSTPPHLPPQLRCPHCDCSLAYVHSHVGGVNAKYPEQWDHFDCPTGCGSFDYRHRTRQLRRRS
jgi:CheY-like chemotaxis protein